MIDAVTKKARATIVGTACLFAAAYWTLDAGNELWRSNSGIVAAFLPEGGEFVSRAVFALVFAIAGLVVGAAIQRSRDIELFAVDQLQESERKYRALMASSFDSVVTLDARARIVEMSESAAGLFNGALTNLVGQSIDDYVRVARQGNDTPAPESIRAILQQNASLPEFAIAVEAKTVSGREFPAEVRITRMPAGAESAFVLAVRETTSRVVAQKALRHSERRYQSLFDNILEGVYRSLPDGRMLAANPAMVRLLGYDSVDELLASANTRDLYAEPQQRHKLLTLLEEHAVARNYEFDLRRRDGSVVKVLANIRAIPTSSTDDVIYEGSLIDISDLEKARAALEESEQHFRALCEHSLDVITVIDSEGLILYSSPSSKSLTGRSPSEQVGLKLFRTVHKDDIDEVLRIVREGFSKPGTPHNFTCRVHRHDGELRYLESVGTAFLGSENELRALIHSRDVTERVESEAELRELQKVQVVGRLTNGLAHDFNNLLTVISGNVELLGERVSDNALQPHLVSALNACRQGQDLTRRLMAFMNPESDQQLVEETNVNGVLLDLESVLHRSLSDAIELETDFADDLWPVLVDAAQLEAVMLQLAVNAKEAMNDSGSLKIVTRNCSNSARGASESDPVTQCVCICVNDDGPGMDNDVLLRATEPFFSTHDEESHTGLGLSAVKRFAESCGGEMRISSEPGCGTSVQIFLPRYIRAAENSDGRDLSGHGERVLVVDDNADVCNASASLLSSLGYEVLTAAGGDEALEIIRQEKVDLLFTDVAMPRMPGTTLAKLAAEHDADIKILLTSGNDAATNEARDGLHTPYEMIRKPFRKQRLAEQVRMALDK